MISFHVPKATVMLIATLLTLAEKEGVLNKDDRMSNMMDLEACIAQGCPLDLERMIKEYHGEHRFSVIHDLYGIQRHLDRDDNSPTGGQLLNCFVPRFAMPKLSATEKARLKNTNPAEADYRAKLKRRAELNHQRV